MKNKIIVLAFFIAVFSTVASANSLYLEKIAYSPGETATAAIMLENENDYQVTWKVECSFLSNDSFYPPTLFSDTVNLDPGETIVLNYSLGIENTTPSGTFAVKAVARNMTMIPVWENETYFSVSGTLLEMNFSIRICKVQGCQQSEAVFFRNENAYIEYTSSAEGITATAEITSPDKGVTAVILPASITLNHEGAYSARALASKEGYSNSESYADFAAIVRQATIIESNFFPISTTTTIAHFAGTTSTISSTSTTSMSITLLTTTTRQACSGMCGIQINDCLCGSDCLEKGNCCPDSCSECGVCYKEKPASENLPNFIILLFLIVGIIAAFFIFKIISNKKNKF